uniref:Uncharacterized protein n=1 Tax=Parascaris equorum TaxID=6256 RepID=A0A914SBN3_PAREQ
MGVNSRCMRYEVGSCCAILSVSENLNAAFVIDSPKVLSRSRKDDDDSGRPWSPEEADLKALKNGESENRDGEQMRDDNLSKKSADWEGEAALSRGGRQPSRQRVDSKPEQENEYIVHDGETTRTTTSRQQDDGVQIIAEAKEVMRQEEASFSAGSNGDKGMQEEASIVIQAAWRGYAVRKKLRLMKECRFLLLIAQQE